MSREKNRIDMWDTEVSVWETGVDEASLRRRVFDPLIRHLRTRGWRVRHDPKIARDYPSLNKWRRLATRGDLVAKVELTGSVVHLEIWQEP